MLADRFPRGPAVPAAKCWRAMGSDWGLKKSVRRGIGCRTICDRKNLTAHTQLPSSFSFCACVSARTEFPSWKPKAFSSFFLSFYFFSGAIDWAQVRKISQGADGAAHGRQHSLVTVCIPLRQRQQTKAGDAHVSSGSSIIFFFAKEKKKRIFFPPKKMGFPWRRDRNRQILYHFLLLFTWMKTAKSSANLLMDPRLFIVASASLFGLLLTKLSIQLLPVNLWVKKKKI